MIVLFHEHLEIRGGPARPDSGFLSLSFLSSLLDYNGPFINVPFTLAYHKLCREERDAF